MGLHANATLDRHPGAGQRREWLPAELGPAQHIIAAGGLFRPRDLMGTAYGRRREGTVVLLSIHGTAFHPRSILK